MKLIIILLLQVTCITNYIIAHDFIYNNFWSAVKDSEDILVCNTSDDKIKQYCLLPNNIVNVHYNMDGYLSKDMIYKSYMFPVKKNNILKYKLPFVSVTNREMMYSIISKYRNIKNCNEEIDFLKDIIRKQTFIDLHITTLQRLKELNFFNRVLSSEEVNFIIKTYRTNNENTLFKRIILEEIALYNFLKFETLFEEALQEPDVQKLAGKIYFTNNKKNFKKIINKYSNDSKLWHYALAQSELMLDDIYFINKMLQYYNHKKIFENSVNFIPLIVKKASSNDWQGRRYISLIKSFLNSSKNTTHFMLYNKLSRHLLKYSTDNYNEDIKCFILNNIKIDYIRRSIIYPRMLYALKEVEDPEIKIITIRYFDILIYQKNRKFNELVCLLWNKNSNNKKNLDELIIKLRNKYNGEKK